MPLHRCLYPVETHIAEKVHAYTMPRPRPNSRVKDLPDLALLATAQPLAARRLRAALERTFVFRKTHALPPALPEPPPTWTAPYATMARANRLRWATLHDVTTAAQAFLDPILAGGLDATWDPATWAWARVEQATHTLRSPSPAARSGTACPSDPDGRRGGHSPTAMRPSDDGTQPG